MRWDSCIVFVVLSVLLLQVSSAVSCVNCLCLLSVDDVGVVLFFNSLLVSVTVV